jgi:hypothetical protein
MAIRHNIAEANSQYGIAFNGAYYRIVTAAISRQRGTDPKFSVMIDLSAYATSTPTDDTREVDFKRYQYGGINGGISYGINHQSPNK